MFGIMEPRPPTGNFSSLQPLQCPFVSFEELLTGPMHGGDVRVEVGSGYVIWAAVRHACVVSHSFIHILDVGIVIPM